MPDKKIMIKVDDVSKSFRLPHEKTGSVKSIFVNPFKRRSYEVQKVLQSSSFEVKQGEFFGIVGRNGSGKSTMLKLLAEIYTPDKGTIAVNGHLTPFIELGVGFNPELSGRENVYLNGALLGFNRDEMDEMYEEIVSFAELERFMDQKLKNYSSGMQVRLAFSIAIRARSDILLIDEVLAVGDAAFQRKCYETFSRLKSEGRTIVFITHDMSAVERFCDRAAVIDSGKMLGIYAPSEAASIYQQLNATYEKEANPDKKDLDDSRWGTKEMSVEKLRFLNKGKPLKQPVFTSGENFSIELTVNNSKKLDYIVGLAFEDAFGINVAGPNSMGKKLGKNKVIFSIDRLALLEGDYKLTVVLFDTSLSTEYDHLEKWQQFRVVPAKGSTMHGKVDLFGEWK